MINIYVYSDREYITIEDYEAIQDQIYAYIMGWA